MPRGEDEVLSGLAALAMSDLLVSGGTGWWWTVVEGVAIQGSSEVWSVGDSDVRGVVVVMEMSGEGQGSGRVWSG